MFASELLNDIDVNSGEEVVNLGGKLLAEIVGRGNGAFAAVSVFTYIIMASSPMLVTKGPVKWRGTQLTEMTAGCAG